MRRLTSDKASRFTESVIREMTRLILEHQGDRGVNLAQGFPDFPAPAALKAAACEAVVPGSSFYHRSELGRTKVRFAFCKQLETLERAATLLGRVRAPQRS